MREVINFSQKTEVEAGTLLERPLQFIEGEVALSDAGLSFLGAETIESEIAETDASVDSQVHSSENTHADTAGLEKTNILDKLSGRVKPLAPFIAAAALFATAEGTANAQIIKSQNLTALEQFYDGYTKQFPDPIYVKPLSDFYNPNTANWKCGGPQQILGQTTYKFNSKTKELTADVERKSAIYADDVVMTADPTPGVQTASDQVWEKLALNCSSLVELRAKMQFFAVLPSHTKSGKKVTSWQRVPGTASINLPEWQPSAVRNQATDDPAVNVPLSRADTIKVKVSKNRKAKELIGKKGVYPTLVLETKSTIKDYESKTAVILGRLSTQQTTVNAGSKYFGKGGALRNVPIFDK